MKYLLRIFSLFRLFGTGFVLFTMSAGLISQPLPDIVFVSRNLEHGGNLYFPQSGLLPGMGPFSRFKVVGGRLIVRETNTTIRVLVDSTMNFNGLILVDVSDPDVFWDASKIVFAGVEHRDSSWRIYEINSNGTGFRKITYTNRNISLAQFGSSAYKFQKYDDIDPCYLSDGRICFSSTRYPSLSEYYGVRTTNLYVINSDGSNLHRITTERNSAEEPTINPVSGRIVFSRWWLNFDRPSIVTYNGLTRDSGLAFSNDIANVWQAGTVNPDGDALQLYAGFPESRNGLHTYKPYILNDGKLLSVFVPHTPMVYTSGSTGIRWFNKGVDHQHYLAGVNQDNMQLYIQNPPSYGTMQPPYAADPVQLPDGRILFSYASQVENQDYALYTINLDGSNMQPAFDIPGKLELNAQVLQSRQVPPVIPDGVTYVSDELPPTSDPGTYYKNGGFRFDCVNIFTNGQVDQTMTDAPPITKNARINFFLNFQRTDTLGLDSAILFHTESVDYAGGVHFENAPADVPMFEQVVDSNGKVVHGTKHQVAHVTGMNYGRPGTGTKCVGCHAGHTTIPVPPTVAEGEFFNTSTSASVTQSSFRFVNDTVQYPGKRVVDRKARNDTLLVNWIATGANNEFVDLKWDLPLDVSDVVIYNIKPNFSNGTNIQVTDCELFLYLNGIEVKHIASAGIISGNGTKISIPDLPKADELKVIVKSFTGQITGQNVAGLAEVETIARISFYEIIGVKQITTAIPDKFSLSQNYPNPFNPVTKIKFTVPSVGAQYIVPLRIVIYDILGREISTLVHKHLLPGAYEVEWNGSNYPSGIYFYRLEAGDFSQTRKMVLVK
jgi:Secretion system C-terminal sorting domain